MYKIPSLALLTLLSLTTPADALIERKLSYTSGGGGSCATLTSQEFHLDAANTSSWDTGGTSWDNLISSPASGASQTDYDWYLGTTSGSDTSDPTHTGTAGTAGAYWDMVSGDVDTFASELGATSNSWMDGMAESTGGDWTIAFAVRFDTVASAYNLWSNGRGGSSFEYGMEIRTSGTTLQINARCTTNASASVSPTLAIDTDYVIIVSHDNSANELDVWVNGTRYDSTLTLPGTCNPSRPPSIGTKETTNSPMDGHLYGVKAYDEFFDSDDKANQVLHEFETETNIDIDGSGTTGDC